MSSHLTSQRWRQYKRRGCWWSYPNALITLIVILSWRFINSSLRLLINRKRLSLTGRATHPGCVWGSARSCPHWKPVGSTSAWFLVEWCWELSIRRACPSLRQNTTATCYSQTTANTGGSGQEVNFQDNSKWIKYKVLLSRHVFFFITESLLLKENVWNDL